MEIFKIFFCIGHVWAVITWGMTNIWSAVHIDFTDISEMEELLSFARESVDKNTIHQKIDSVFSFLYDFKSIILKTE